MFSVIVFTIIFDVIWTKLIALSTNYNRSWVFSNCLSTNCNRIFTFNSCSITNCYCIYCAVTYSCIDPRNISFVTNRNCTACSCNFAIITNSNSICRTYIVWFITQNSTTCTKCNCASWTLNLSKLTNGNSIKWFIELISPIVINVCSSTNCNRIFSKSICIDTRSYRAISLCPTCFGIFTIIIFCYTLRCFGNATIIVTFIIECYVSYITLIV